MEIVAAGMSDALGETVGAMNRALLTYGADSAVFAIGAQQVLPTAARDMAANGVESALVGARSAAWVACDEVVTDQEVDAFYEGGVTRCQVASPAVGAEMPGSG